LRNIGARQPLSGAQRTEQELPARLALEWLRTGNGQRYDFYIATKAMMFAGYFAALGFECDELEVIRAAQVACTCYYETSREAEHYAVDEAGFRLLAEGLDVLAVQLGAATGADLQAVVRLFEQDGEARSDVRRAA